MDKINKLFIPGNSRLLINRTAMTDAQTSSGLNLPSGQTSHAVEK